MTRSEPIKMVKVSGTHREMGRQVGEACGEEIHRMLSVYKDSFQSSFDQLRLEWDEAVLQANKYYPFAQEHMPQYIDELDGMAEAAGVEFDDLMVLNCTEAIMSDALYLGCTSIAVSGERTATGHVLVGHNEDWLPEDEVNAYLIHAKPEGEPPYLAMTYGGLLPNIGFNAAGIAQCCDSVYPDDVRVGIPRIFVSRAVLGADRLSEAIRGVLHRQRAAGYNHLIAHSSGELYNIEVSALHFATIYGMEGMLAHTNNYLTRRMKQYENSTEDLISARVRVNRATRLVRHTRQHTADSFKTILSDHVNFPNSICNHIDKVDNPLDRQKTIVSMIMDLTSLELHACWGNPCESPYHTYKLEV